MTIRDLKRERLIAFEEKNDCNPVEFSVEVSPHYDETLKIDGIIEIWTNSDGKFDRDFGPAVLFIAAESEEIVYEQWYKNGEFHREGSPAVI